MENSYPATTVEMDRTGFAELENQLLDSKIEKSPKQEDIRDRPQPSPKNKESASKKYVFKKGDQALEIDDDFELEMMADKRPLKLTLRELKDRAAGDIAVKNRMHALAEEKKRVQHTFKEFANLAKSDPLGALEYISEKANEADGDFEYNKYIEKLAEQAEKLGQMDEKERKAWELEKKLHQAEKNLSLKEREAAVVLRKQEILTDYPEIGDSEISQMVEAVLSNEELSAGLNDENDVMDRVEELVQETLTQRDIMTVINEINPSYIRDNRLIFTLSDQIKQNPDLEEDDIRDIIRELIAPREVVQSPRSSQRDRDIRTLSNKQRQGMNPNQIQQQNATPFELLADQLKDYKKNNSRTPLNKR